MRLSAFVLVFCFGTSLGSRALALTEDQAKQEYYLIKREVLKSYSGPNYIIGKTWIVFDCGFTKNLDFLGAGAQTNNAVPDWALLMFSLAKGVAQLRQTAIAAGYPEESWKGDLITHEETNLQKIIPLVIKNSTQSKATPKVSIQYPTSIVEAMNAYRVRKRLKLPALQDIDGCGAGEASVSLKTIPDASKIFIIPEFFALICEKTGRYTTIEACPYWRDVPKTNDLEVSGLYRFVILWSSGAARKGKLDFDKFLKPGEVINIEIRGQ